MKNIFIFRKEEFWAGILILGVESFMLLLNFNDWNEIGRDEIFDEN